MADASDGFVLALVVVGALLLLFTPLGDIIAGWFNQGEPVQTWQANVYASDIGAGRTFPSGNISVTFGESLDINAEAFDGWAFDQWTLNGSFFSASPVAVVPSQSADEVVNVVAEFEPLASDFEISPTMTLVRGDSVTGYNIAGWRRLVLDNNLDASIYNVRIRLNDNYGIFSNFEVMRSYGYYSIIESRYKCASVLNTFGDVMFVDYAGSTPILSTKTYTLPANDEGIITIMEYAVNSDIEAGTYNLSFNIIFSTNSDVDAQTLVIPWTIKVI